jgi:chemotaxis protein CheD
MAANTSTSWKGNRIDVGVADMKCSDDPIGYLATRALGSCIGLTAYDPITKVGGLLHYMLGQPRDKDKARLHPHMFALSGVPALFRAICELGGQRERLIVCAAGGAVILDDPDGYSIGKRNHAVLRKLFWKNGIVLHGEDCGGSAVRDMKLDLGTGQVIVSSQNEEKRLWPVLTKS